MSEAETIKEFLVALGYKIDEAGGRKFSKALSDAAKDALKLGGALAAAMTALELFTDKMAGSVENLYFMSQRTGAAIANIKGYAFAATQLGSSAEAAAASLENMGEFLRNNPAGEGYLNAIKVQTRDVNGGLLDTSKIMTNLGGQLAQMPNWQAKQFADFFKIDEKTLLALKSGEYTRFLADHNRRLEQAGVDMADLGVQSHIYEENWRQLKDEVDIVGDQLLTKVLPATTSIVKVTESWLEDLTSATSKIDQIKAAHYSGIGDYLDKRGTGGAIWDVLAAGPGAIAGELYDAAKFTGKTAYIGTAAIFGSQGSGQRAVRDMFGPSQATTGTDNERRILDTLQGMGWTAQQSAGILANLKAESGLDPFRPGDSGQAFGIGQWHADRQAVFKQLFGHDLQLFGHDLQHSNLDEQLRFVNWELNNTEARAGNALRGTGSAGDAGAIVSALYERPKDTFGQASLRSEDAERIYQRQGAGQVTIHQTNTTTVHGASDPNGVSVAIGNAQASANASLTRNVAGAVQ